MRINSNAENINELINSLPDNLIMHGNPKRWLLLFLTTANQCGNCMNEINDYLDIAKRFNKTN